MNQLEIVGVREFDTLDTPILLSFDYVLLSNNCEVRLMCQ